MGKIAEKATVHSLAEATRGICPKDSKKMVATRVVRHEGRSGMFWVCECGHMEPIH